MKKTILRIFFKPLTLINKVIPKDKNLIFFYSNLGFRDNVKGFYDYLIEAKYNEKYKIVVSINDFEEYVDKAPKNVSFIDNKKGIKVFMKAKYAFYCFGKYPIKPSKKQTVINLWHGTPLKKLGNLEKGCEKIDYNFFTKIITASEMYVPIMAEIFGCKESQVEVFGYPRNDEMFKHNKLVDVSVRRGCNKLFIWLPTYREYNDDFLVSILEDKHFEMLNRFLAEQNCRLVIKLHPLQQINVSGMKYSHIDIITQQQLNKQNMSVYSLLRNADALITDYSSVYFDYMLLDRPIAFAIDDIANYQDKRGFVFENPKDYMPGMNINNAEDVVSFMTDVIEGNDSFAEERRRVNDIVNKYKDGNASECIARHFIK